MACSLLSHLLVMLSAVYCAAAQERASNITQGSSLTPTENPVWQSSSGLFAFGFYRQGDNRYGVGIFFAGLPHNKTVVWTANRDDPPVSNDVTLRLTPDGRLVIQQKSQESPTDVVKLNQSISYASILDSGNFVLYGSNQEMIWQSFDHPTDAILPGQILSEERDLVSGMTESDYSQGKFRLKMQGDANLVLYPAKTIDSSLNSYWSTGTFGNGGLNVTLNLDSNGHLYLRGYFGFRDSFYVLQNLTEGFPEKQRVYLMKIDFDGILRLYSLSLDGKGNSSSVVWNAPTNRCDPKGLCGSNAYCTLTNDGGAKCECPFGFNYISLDSRNDCERNYTVDGCNNKDQTIQYNMTQLQHTWWENDPDSVDQMKTKEECEAACLEDCKCEAALFKDGDCKKVSLPLRYGKYSSTDSTIAYIKWAPPKAEKNNKDRSVIPVLIGGIGGGLAVMLVILLVSYWGVRQQRRRQSTKLKENFFKQNGGIMLQQLLHKAENTAERAKIYTEEELKKATNNYDENNVIGQGGYGTVYKGLLDDTFVAIKRSKVVDRSQIDQFVNEMIILSQISHPNVVKLLGCCLETPVPLLVYEYVTNDTLYYHIHDEDSATSIPWNMRLRIATETAGALAHMHSAPVHIIHRDVKSANILLDDEYTAKVSDFGVSRLFSPEETHLATLVQGTFGYIDPEYFHSGILTQKSDVYSFGVVLAELLTGAKVVSFGREEKNRNLGLYFLSALEDDRLYTILEPRVRKEGHPEQLEGAAEIAKKCLRIEGAKRPKMKEVEEELVQLRQLNIEDYTLVEIGPNIKDREPLLDEVIQSYDSNVKGLQRRMSSKSMP
ncbi:Receptor-like serine/threonine-protein kinase [Heracleum sosnowskyi]|uniref:Receptor-like serine/threonine-protein kinase n=1 Tax=Heracleum sosnowskyi TaxID=360622 RepID=A0AAD8MFI3_9APIA|nr:Receptor-like serine/threonine-protein kinase [Heracleum sosnowskyi]